MSSHTSLKGFDSVGESLLSDQLESNLISFFQWGLLGKGGFWNVRIPASGAYYGNDNRLKPVTDPSYTDGQVWEAFRQDWVWESGVENPTQPIRVSGVFVNGNFKPVSGVGAYKHHVDYRYGRVVFDTAISTSSTVTCEYSTRMYGVFPANTPFWREIQPNSYRSDSFLTGSGLLNCLATNRVQLPAVIVHVVPRSERYGYELGNLVQTVRQDVLFHILAETPYDAGQLHDIITLQQEKRIVAYDKNRVLSDERFGLASDGSPAVSGIMYPDLVKPSGDGGYGWRQLRFIKMTSVDLPQRVMAPIYTGIVRGTFEVELP